MAKTTTSTTKADSVETVSMEPKESKESKVSETKSSGTTEKEVKKTDGNGLPFNVNPDGTVEVWSKKRAGRSVIGASGDIVTFDDKGFAKVNLEDALHFKDVPGFSFKG